MNLINSDKIIKEKHITAKYDATKHGFIFYCVIGLVDFYFLLHQCTLNQHDKTNYYEILEKTVFTSNSIESFKG
jgi:hypothetical protein